MYRGSNFQRIWIHKGRIKFGRVEMNVRKGQFTVNANTAIETFSLTFPLNKLYWIVSVPLKLSRSYSGFWKANPNIDRQIILYSVSMT